MVVYVCWTDIQKQNKLLIGNKHRFLRNLALMKKPRTQNWWWKHMKFLRSWYNVENIDFGRGRWEHWAHYALWDLQNPGHTRSQPCICDGKCSVESDYQVEMIGYIKEWHREIYLWRPWQDHSRKLGKGVKQAEVLGFTRCWLLQTVCERHHSGAHNYMLVLRAAAVSLNLKMNVFG